MQATQQSSHPPTPVRTAMSMLCAPPIPPMNIFHGAGHLGVGGGDGPGAGGGLGPGFGAGGPTPQVTSSHHGSKWLPSGPGSAPPCRHCGHW